MSSIQKQTLLKLLILGLIFSFVLTQTDDGNDNDDETISPLQAFRDQLKSITPNCTIGLANAYGLNGVPSPQKASSTGWGFCPNIKNTCCSNDDVESAFATVSGGLKNLKQHFVMYKQIARDFIEQLQIIRAIAYRVHRRSLLPERTYVASRCSLVQVKRLGVMQELPAPLSALRLLALLSRAQASAA